MSLSRFFQPSRTALSFELFPPKTEKGESSLYRNVENLIACNPDFITCTYGAGGSTRDKTMEIVCEVKRRFNIPVASHLTLVDSTQQQLRDYLSRAKSNGVDFIVALRGDPPAGSNRFHTTPGGLSYANQLVELITGEFPDFGIAVAGYPEKHVEAPDPQTDLHNLKRKVDAGADVVITQLFYDNNDFFRFRDQCRQTGITVPIVPGILPVTNLSQVQRIVSLCGAKLPKTFVDRLAMREDDVDWHFQVGVEHATAQVEQLIASESDGLHFYVLNKSRATTEILSAVELAP